MGWRADIFAGIWVRYTRAFGMESSGFSGRPFVATVWDVPQCLDVHTLSRVFSSNKKAFCLFSSLHRAGYATALVRKDSAVSRVFSAGMMIGCCTCPSSRKMPRHDVECSVHVV